MNNFNINIQKLFSELGNNKNMVLSTSYNDIITSRMMSVIIHNGLFYFQTDRTFRKYHQILNNPNIALCADNISIEGVCTEIGKPRDNKDFINLYKQYYKSSYQIYSSLRNEILFMVEPKYIQRWIYEDSKPYIEIFDFENKVHKKSPYELVNMTNEEIL